MQLEGRLSLTKTSEQLQGVISSSWKNLNQKQKELIKKIWKVVTFKWQWQIGLNAPFLVIWLLDRTIPAVHKFDLQLLSSLPIPKWLSIWIG
tara:strand:- start:113 stop:388 length:276 start_codon:yes stop_codon:yes gene_type:complete